MRAVVKVQERAFKPFFDIVTTQLTVFIIISDGGTAAVVPFFMQKTRITVERSGAM